MSVTEIRIAGFGGQGVILSAMVVGKAASIFEGGFATMTQSFGPEARGGACSAPIVPRASHGLLRQREDEREIATHAAASVDSGGIAGDR